MLSTKNRALSTILGIVAPLRIRRVRWDMAGTFRVLEHTADVGLEVEGATLDELFAAAACGLTALFLERPEIEATSSQTIVIEAEAVDLLLHRWLSELLFEFDVKRWLVARADVRVEVRPGQARLRAWLDGSTFDPGRHQARQLVKAVTYHALTVEPRGDGWYACVIVDI